MSTHSAARPHTALRTAAVASFLAGAVHYAVVPAHRAEWWLAALVLTLFGAAQIAWAVMAWQVPERRLLPWGVGISALAVVLWAGSRIWGLPVGPHAGHPEMIGIADLVCVVAELIAVAAGLAVYVRGLSPGAARAET